MKSPKLKGSSSAFLRPAHDLAAVVDGVGQAVVAAERSEVDDLAVFQSVATQIGAPVEGSIDPVFEMPEITPSN